MAAQEKVRFRLRTVEDINAALEDLYERQRDGNVDAKAADGMNTTIKGAMALNVKLPMDALKIFVQASIKKVIIPQKLRAQLPVSFE